MVKSRHKTILEKDRHPGSSGPRKEGAVRAPLTQRIYDERLNLALCDTRDGALQGADALILVTEWKAYDTIDFDYVKAAPTWPVIFAGRNVYDSRPQSATAPRFFAWVGRRSASA